MVTPALGVCLAGCCRLRGRQRAGGTWL